MTNHWNIRTDWDLVGPPLKPTRSDIKFIDNIIKIHFPNRHIELLILGATKELVEYNWSNHNSLECIDQSINMLNRLPFNLSNTYIHDNWYNYNWHPDCIIGDGVLTVLDDCNKFVRKMRDIILPGNLLILRVFIPSSETPNQINSRLNNGEFSNFNLYKLKRMSSLINKDYKVKLHDIWESWYNNVSRIDDGPLAKTMEIFKDNYDYYSFHPIDKIQEMFSKYFNLTVGYIDIKNDYAILTFERNCNE